jgi:EmrB/QacA subfamily drug resistance transporter
MAFLDATVVNVALPNIGEHLDTGLAGLQWVVNGYLVTLTALVLLGGSIGDRFGQRRVFLTGIVWFSVASLLCGVAPNIVTLVAARGLQGIGAALAVPGSLALLTGSMHPDDRARAVGAWSGLTGVATAAGPFVGGWLVDTASWRWVFLLNLPFALAVLVLGRKIPERPLHAELPLDLTGAAAAAVGLALTTAGLIEHRSGWAPLAVVAGLALLGAFAALERRSSHPMIPPSIFSSRQFSGANIVTFLVYAGLGVGMFLIVVNLQLSLGYSALAAGLALFPVTVLMLAGSSRAGALAQRIGPRLPMTLGPLIVAAGFAWLALIEPGRSYLTLTLPAAVVLGIGLTLTVAPLTAVVLGAVPDEQLGIGSGVNNAWPAWRGCSPWRSCRRWPGWSWTSRRARPCPATAPCC